LHHDAERLEQPYAVTDQLFDRIDGCVNAYAGGGVVSGTISSAVGSFPSDAGALDDRGPVLDVGVGGRLDVVRGLGGCASQPRHALASTRWPP
jgi:hypothetical protein